MEVPTPHTISWPTTDGKGNMVNYKLPKLLLIFHGPKQVTWPSLIQWVQRSTDLLCTSRRELEYLCVALVTTRLSFYWQWDWTCLTAMLTLAVLPDPQLCLLLPFSSTIVAGENFWLRKPDHYFLPEEGIDHHLCEIRVAALNKIPREFPNTFWTSSSHLASQGGSTNIS